MDRELSSSPLCPSASNIFLYLKVVVDTRENNVMLPLTKSMVAHHLLCEV